MHKRILLLISIVFISMQSFAQENVYDSTSLDGMSEQVLEDEFPVIPDKNIYTRDFHIHPDSVKLLKNKKQFEYIRNLDSLLKAAQDKATKPTNVKPAGVSFRKIFNSVIIQALLWTMAAGFVIFIIYRLFLSKAFFSKTGGKSQVEEALTTDQEFLNEDFEKLYQQSKKQNDLRSATRYLFLDTLKKLENRSEIEFSVDKTNSKYINELPEHKREMFAWLVMNYEYTWYGKTDPGASRFELVEKRSQEFNSLH